MSIVYLIPGNLSSTNYGVKEIKRREKLLKKWSEQPSKIRVFDVPKGGSSIESSYEEVASIIPAVDRLQELTNFEKHATGFTGMLYNIVSRDMTESFKLDFPSTFSDTIEYANSNNVIKEVNCPRIFGWKFSNNQKESGILTNVTDSSYSISVENAYNSDLLWTHWTAADTLRAYINGYDSIERNYQIGKTNISIPPFSLNTCMTIIIGDVTQDNVINVADIVSMVLFILEE